MRAAQFVSHLECALTGERFNAGQLHTVSSAGKPLLVRYFLDQIERAVERAELARRPSTLWRYRELLPLPGSRQPISLGETITPLIDLPALRAELDLGALWVKDEGRLPTGSFKARGLVMAVNMAKWLGVTRMAIPPMAMPARRWRPIACVPASRRSASVRPTRRKRICARSNCRGRRWCVSTA